MNKTATKKSEKMLREIMDNVGNWSEYTEDELLLANNCLAKSNGIEGIDNKVKKLSLKVATLWKTPSKYDDTLSEEDDLSFVCSNGKAVASIDFQNYCSYKCSYCYVQSSYAKARLEKIGKWKVSSDYLTPRREKRFRLFLNWFKENLPRNYPLRFFSLADCEDDNTGLLQKLLRVCKEENVKTIVISKNENAIMASYGLADSVLYSVDIGKYDSPTSFKRYVELQREMINLKAFLMVVDFEELEAFQFMIKYSGIPSENFQFVAYHGTQDVVDSTIGTIVKPMFLNMLTNGNACCSATNKCLGCHLMCGLGKGSNNKYTLYRSTKGKK